MQPNKGRHAHILAKYYLNLYGHVSTVVSETKGNDKSLIVSFSVEWREGKGAGGGGRGGEICDHTSNYVKEHVVVAHYCHDKEGKPMK